MMGANSNVAMHVDLKECPVYDEADLHLFHRILNDIVEEEQSGGVLSANEKAYLKARLAIEIFKRAATGDRDYARLKRGAIEAVSAVPPSVS